MKTILRTILLLFLLFSPIKCDDGSSSSPALPEGNEGNENLLIFAFLLVLAGAVLVIYLVVKSEIHYIPESVAVVVYGILIGLILRFITTNVAERLATFDPDIFFLFLLPSIIFESGFSLQKTPFFSNIGSILVFAIFGTLISFGFSGILFYLLGQAGASMELSLQDSMTTGALLSATDPVATLAIFQALNVDQQLYMVIFGESILNDAVALILFRASLNYKEGEIMSTISIFFLIAFGSLFLGVAVAVVMSALFRVLNISRFPPLETIFMIIFSYLSYVLADALHLSGIMSVFWCGIVFNHYGAYSLSPYTTLTSRQLFRTLAFVCEITVFLYIGISITTTQLLFDAKLVFWTIVLCLVGRAIHVFPICFIMNRFKKNKFTPQIQLAIWFAGLRGAIAFSLSLNLTTPAAPYIKTATLIFVHFTLFFMGVGTLPLLKVLKIKSATADQSLDHISKPREKTKGKESTKSFIGSLDEKYLKYWLRRPVPPLAREAVDLFERLVHTSNEAEMKPSRMISSPESKAPAGYRNVSSYDLDRDNIISPPSPHDLQTTGQALVHIHHDHQEQDDEEISHDVPLLQ
eukprot:Phypoly_transcript_00533.p1 GENE.Phypoly_transcript_00533~~Phypoly_transcript_00533.p1  ORF type:complete len:579 (+),score=54.52 Phypoly_transcript_00533:2748-4484(+)